MKRILFVDDEPLVLSGLRRMLDDFEDQWSMEFAESGPAALEILRTQPFDVIVTDMRMPGMDGVELLTRVRSEFPDMTRICLSGHSNEESSLKVAGLAHQYLSKPCDSERLEATVVRACALRDHLLDPLLRQALASLESIPSLPASYEAVTAELNRPQPSLAKLGELISQDAAMTAKILQLVNSSFFGLGRRLSNVHEAVALLGLRTVNALVVSTGLFTHLESANCGGQSADELMDHSLAVAGAAKAIAATASKDRDLINDAFVAGLLHDIGKLVLAAGFKNKDANGAQSEASGTSSTTVECERFGMTHADAGAYLMELWGLPSALVEAIAFHHFPEQAMATEFTPLTAVHVANALIHERDDDGAERAAHGVHFKYLFKLQLLNRLDEWRELVRGVGKELAGAGA